MKYISAIVVCLGLLGFSATEATAAPPVQSVRYQHDHHDVYYRLSGWRSRHFHDHHAAHRFMDALRNLGCQVYERDHDVFYICQRERFAHFDDHYAAYNFMAQMRALGFSVHMH